MSDEVEQITKDPLTEKKRASKEKKRSLLVRNYQNITKKQKKR